MSETKRHAGMRIRRTGTLLLFASIAFGGFLRCQDAPGSKESAPPPEPAQPVAPPEGKAVRTVIVAEAVPEQEKGRCVAIAVTGNLQALIQWCACPTGSHFMSAKRAQVVRETAAEGGEHLLVDAGEAFSGDAPLDRLRAESHLKIMSSLGYRAAFLGEDCWRVGADFVREKLLKSGLRWMCANVVNSESLEPVSGTVTTVTVNGKTVWLIALASKGRFAADLLKKNGLNLLDPVETYSAAAREAGPDAALRVVFGALESADTERLAALPAPPDVVLSSGPAPRPSLGLVAGKWLNEAKTARMDWPNWRVRVNRTLVCYTEIAGDSGVTEISVVPASAGGLPQWYSRQVRTTAETPDDPEVLKLVEEFFQGAKSSGVADSSEHRKTAWGEAVQKGASFVGAKACRECHPAQYESWLTTKHTASYADLVVHDRWFYPDCIACHTTGFGYGTGFAIGDKPMSLMAMHPLGLPSAPGAGGDSTFPLGFESVQCEACHGPASLHCTDSKQKGTIRRDVPTEVCVECHTPKNSANFAASESEMRRKIAH